MQKLDQFMAVLESMAKTKPPIAANPKTLAIRYRAQAIIEREGGDVTCKDIAKEIGENPKVVQSSLTARQRSLMRVSFVPSHGGKTGYFTPDFTAGEHRAVIASMRFDIDQEE